MKRHCSRIAGVISTALLTIFLAGQAFAADLMGQPTDGAIDFQPAVVMNGCEALKNGGKSLMPNNSSWASICQCTS